MNLEKYNIVGSNLVDEFGERLVEKKIRYEQLMKELEVDEKFILEIQKQINSKKKRLISGIELIDKKLQDETLIEHASRILYGAQEELLEGAPSFDPLIGPLKPVDASVLGDIETLLEVSDNVDLDMVYHKQFFIDPDRRKEHSESTSYDDSMRFLNNQ